MPLRYNGDKKCVAVTTRECVAIKFKGGQNLSCHHCFSKASYDETLPLFSLPITHNTYQTNMRLLVQYQSLKHHSLCFTVKSKHKELNHDMSCKTVPSIAMKQNNYSDQNRCQIEANICLHSLEASIISKGLLFLNQSLL